MDFGAKNVVKPLKRDFGIPKGERMEKSSSRISLQGQALSFREDNGVMILRSGFFGWIKHLDTSDMDNKKWDGSNLGGVGIPIAAVSW